MKVNINYCLKKKANNSDLILKPVKPHAQEKRVATVNLNYHTSTTLTIHTETPHPNNTERPNPNTPETIPLTKRSPLTERIAKGNFCLTSLKNSLKTPTIFQQILPKQLYLYLSISCRVIPTLVAKCAYARASYRPGLIPL